MKDHPTLTTPEPDAADRLHAAIKVLASADVDDLADASDRYGVPFKGLIRLRFKAYDLVSADAPEPA